MAAKEKEYRRLPGRGMRRQGIISAVAVRSRLWLGKDHVLMVDSQWYSEDYRRFYFRDIQAVMFRKTKAGSITNIVLAAIACPALAGAIALGGGGGTIFFGIVAGVLLFFLALNTLFGPTCVCQMSTAVQTEPLPSLRRLRTARKVVARLRPLIAEAQGQLNPDEIPARMAQLAQPAGAVASPVEAPPTATVIPGDSLPPPGT